MLAGKLNPQVSIDYDTTEKIFETTVTGSAVTSIDITGLEGDTDEQYMLDVSRVDDGNCANLAVRFNGDTGSNYGYQLLSGSDTTTVAARGATVYLLFGVSGTTGYLSGGNMLIHAKSGYVRTVLCNYTQNVTGTTVDTLRTLGQAWNNTGDEITSINILNSGAGDLGIGTSISLYRRIEA